MMRTCIALALGVLSVGAGCGEDVELANPDNGPLDGCIVDGPECNNCIDDDHDGLIDGFDPHCISALDDRENSFATGIPGDNIDAVKQDCFFDGNSGGGNDGCDLHVCCLLDVNGTGDCPAHLRPEDYDPSDCTPSDRCIENCGPLAPPGCDCFGCCTVCNDGSCHDVLLNPAVSPNCDLDGLGDPGLCPACVKSPLCGPECDPQNCILCPGQDSSDLPPECAQQVCPGGRVACQDNTDCDADQFCANGCCVDVVQ